MKSGKTKAWLGRHRRDAYVKQAAVTGWRSRAACKLVEIDDRHNLLAAARNVVDLGAAPGGWCQVARKRLPGDAFLLGIDLQDCQPLPGVTFVRGDFTDAGLASELMGRFSSSVDLMLSDAAPDISGIRLRDEAACERLHEAVFSLAGTCGAGALVLKSFEGEPVRLARELAQNGYAKVAQMKLKATKKGSRECYVIAKDRIH